VIVVIAVKKDSPVSGRTLRIIRSRPLVSVLIGALAFSALFTGFIQWTILITSAVALSLYEIISLYDKVYLRLDSRFDLPGVVTTKSGKWAVLLSIVVILGMAFTVFAYGFGLTGIVWTLFVLILATTAADASGYFVGRSFGKKLVTRRFSSISPNKTWEGFIGGMIGSYAVGFGLYVYLADVRHLELIEPLVVFTALALLPFAALAGDLLASKFKRLASDESGEDVDDFSHFLGDHGGFMDRFDSLSMVFLVSSVVFIFITFR